MAVGRRVGPGRKPPGRAGLDVHGRNYGLRLLAAIVDSSDDAIFSKTLDGVITTWNKAAERIYGYAAREVLGQPASILMPEDRRDEMARILGRIRRGERVDHFETTRRTKAGDLITVSLTVSPIRSDGEIVGASSIARDITEREHARQALEEANKDLQGFASSVAHDLRAPLRALSGFSEALLEEFGDSLGETGRDYALRIVAASERMGTLIDDLLELSRVARAELRTGPVDLSAEAESVAQELRRRDPARRVHFAIQPGVHATADPALIRTVLQNLLENAWKFTSRQDDATIEFGTIAASGAGVCYVRDDGAGFDQAYAGKLFRPFERLHSSSEFPGSGIGLASVRRIIQRHGGRVWASGATGQGATFYFTLPRTGLPSPS